jgi:hypothetical protein
MDLGLLDRSEFNREELITFSKVFGVSFVGWWICYFLSQTFMEFTGVNPFFKTLSN